MTRIQLIGEIRAVTARAAKNATTSYFEPLVTTANWLSSFFYRIVDYFTARSKHAILERTLAAPFDRVTVRLPTIGIETIEEESLDAVNEMVNNISEEYSNRIQQILELGRRARTSHLQSVLESYSQIQEAAERFSQIEVAALRAHSLVQQLTLPSMMAAANAVSLNFNDVVWKTISMARASITHNIEFAVSLDPLVQTVKAQESAVQQVLTNLILNAQYAMEKGGRLDIQTKQVEVPVENTAEIDSPRRPYVELSVADTGSGMDAETVRRIFEPFFTTKVEGKGTGLRLTIVKDRVEMLGGRVLVDSQISRGTTIRVLIPTA